MDRKRLRGRVGTAVLGAGLLVAATAWGLGVSIGSGDARLRSAELPDPGGREIGSSRVVARAAYGSGDGQVGVRYEGEAEGPRSFGVDDRDRVYVLDQVNARVLRFSEGETDALYPLPGTGFDDIVVARDRLAVLERFGARRVLVFAEDGRRLGETTVAAGVPGILRLRVVEGAVCAECPGPLGMSYHPLASLEGVPASLREQAEPVATDTPSPAGRLSARKVGEGSLTIEVNGTNAPARTVRVNSGRNVSSIIDVFGDNAGNVYTAFGVSRGTSGRLVVVQHDAEGRLASRMETTDGSLPEPSRKIVVTEAGRVYQLLTDESGMRVLRWTLGH